MESCQVYNRHWRFHFGCVRFGRWGMSPQAQNEWEWASPAGNNGLPFNCVIYSVSSTDHRPRLRLFFWWLLLSLLSSVSDCIWVIWKKSILTRTITLILRNATGQRVTVTFYSNRTGFIKAIVITSFWDDSRPWSHQVSTLTLHRLFSANPWTVPQRGGSPFPFL